MSEAITKLHQPDQKAPARAGARFSKSRWPESRSNRFESIAGDPKFHHFTRIPARIVRCLEHFGIGADRIAVAETLKAYYLFIGVTDHAIDAGEIGAAETVLECLETSGGRIGKDGSDLLFITENLKNHFADGRARQTVLPKLHELHRAILAERASVSIESYMAQRETVGRLTAEVSYLLIRPLLRDDGSSLCTFMQEVGAVGCLVDSVIDLDIDRRRGLLSFPPKIRDRRKLIQRTVVAGARILSRHPALLSVFLQAIIDNFRDRIR